MAIITLDFETYYDKDYSLTKMSEVDYILSPLFQVIMCSVKQGDEPVQVFTSHQTISDAINSIDWENSALLSHNSRFDGAILAWRYNRVPGLYLDTLSMARALTQPAAGRSSLKRVAEYMGLPPKGDEVVRMIGRTRESLSDQEVADYAAYCAHDTDLCRMIFDRFMKQFGFPKSELKVIDLALRMFICPQARLDPFKLAEHLNMVRAEKEAAFARVSTIDRSVFSSNIMFAELLQSKGVVVPQKVSPATGMQTWALAKNDRAFKDLCADPEQTPEVQAILACRLGAKSTIDETRAETLLKLSQRDWGAPHKPRAHLMPVPYKYYGAHTGRFSGDGGYNFANLRRGSPLRDAIVAPAGSRVVHRDSSQIEARIVAWLAGCDRLTTAFAEGRDIYSEFATRFYRETVTKADKLRRFTGKTAILSLGYGAGPVKFRHALYIGAGGVSAAVTEEEAEDLVMFYRREYAEIPSLWRRGNQVIERMITQDNHLRPELIKAVYQVEDCLYLPNQMAIQYSKIRNDIDVGTKEPIKVYDSPYGSKRIYGAKMIENITQALARIVVTDIMLRVHRETEFYPFMSTYDSHDYIVPADGVEAFDELLEREFSIVPSWAPDLPLASEGGWGKTLLEAEKGVNQ